YPQLLSVIQQSACCLCQHHEKDQQQTPCEEFLNVVHGVLRVSSRPESPQTTSEPKQKIPVTVIDGFTGTKVPLIIRRTDTIGKLKQALVKKKPHMKGSLNLSLNGKNCLSEKTMSELNVKPGATFITFQRCTGG
uniref:Ubiquitin-like domain-containing protein n=1 Tax=Astyanax mexicanus TaxID=7994 RepID=A0A3B1K3X7_ASTMX